MGVIALMSVGTQDRASATSLHCVVFFLDTGIPASSLC
jgi:hypothetical protein